MAGFSAFSALDATRWRFKTASEADNKIKWAINNQAISHKTYYNENRK